jgi:hypothetical protein
VRPGTAGEHHPAGVNPPGPRRGPETETLLALWRLICTVAGDDDLRFFTAALLVMLLTARNL